MKNIIQSIKKIIDNTKLRNKIFLIIIPITMFTCILILIFSFFVFNRYDELLYQNTSNLLFMTADNIEKDLKEIEQMSESICLNNDLQKALPNAWVVEPTYFYQTMASSVYSILTENYAHSKNVVSISIYNNSQRFCVGSDRSEEDARLLEQIMIKVREVKGKPFWISSGRNDSSVIFVREIKKIQNLTLESLGTLIIRVNLENIITKNLKNNARLGYPPLIRITSETDTIYDDMYTNIDLNRSNGTNNTYAIESIGQQKYFVTYTDHSAFGWNYAMYLPFDTVIGSITRLQVAILITAIVVAVISMFFCVRMVSQITKHFDILVEKMQTFKRGDFAIDIYYDYSDRKDELGFIHQSFDSMVSDIRQLVNDNYVKQLLIKDAQIKSLERQIDPHFLFNILQTLNWKAKANNQNEISVIIESLSKLLRYSLSEKADTVLLKQEIEITENYIAIQKFRYNQRLDVSINIQDSLLNTKIPKLALQEIVENSIKHALENMLDTCYIKIYAKQSDQDFRLFVEDNGPGIDEHMIEKLASKDTLPSGLGIGLLNIHQRIQLLFSSEYGIWLHNTGYGTIVELYMPRED